VEGFFPVAVSIFAAFLVVTATVFAPPKSLALVASSLVLFVCTLRRYPLWGPFPEDLALDFSPPDAALLLSGVVALAIPPLLCTALRISVDKNQLYRATVNHLNRVNTQTLLFNRALQDLAKTGGEEAVKADRLRFTRDLHDGCGYAFTNIIAMTDAAVSLGDLDSGNAQEIFQRIRTLAQTGLRETREILHLIREITEPDRDWIDSLSDVARIFQEVTGINVTMDWGNMSRGCGAEVNTVLTKVVQEAFTNAVRHGQATKIHIHLWKLSGTLTMTVTDNGVGAATVVKGIGLAGMEERLEAVGGTLAVSHPAEGGFRLHISIPLINSSLIEGKHHD
jgi:signal transduction histidine kinase